MPRLPTMRVIGSQFISTRFRDLLGMSLVGAVMVLIVIAPYVVRSGFAAELLIGSWVITGGQFRARMPPPGFFVQGSLRNRAQGPDGTAVDADAGAGNLGPRRFIHERHELIREARHGASDADAANVWAAADAGHPAPLGHVAVHYRSPAPQFHDAFGRAVDLGEIAFFVVAGAVATVVHGLAEQPCGTQLIVQGNHGSQPRHLIEKVEHRLHKVVGLNGTPRNIHNRQSRFRLPAPTQVISQTHAAGGVPFHSMNSAVSGAGPDRDYRQRFGSQPVDPVIGGNRLIGLGIGSHRSPISFLLYLLVRDGALDHQNEGFELAFLGKIKMLHEVVAAFVSEDWVIQMHL